MHGYSKTTVANVNYHQHGLRQKQIILLNEDAIFGPQSDLPSQFDPIFKNENGSICCLERKTQFGNGVKKVLSTLDGEKSGIFKVVSKLKNQRHPKIQSI